jgi:hypothetical protein
MIVESRGYQKLAKQIHENETATPSDVANFCDGIYNVVFQRIYRQLTSSIKGQESDARSSKAAKELLEALGELRSQFGKSCLRKYDAFFLMCHNIELESKQITQPDIPARYPSPLVSALLDLLGLA